MIRNLLHLRSLKKMIKLHFISKATMKSIILIIVLLFESAHVFAQMTVDSLFSLQNPLDIGLSMSIKQVRKSKEDTSYLSHKLCYFPPLWISIEKKDAKGTLFEGNKKLKLV